MVSDFYEKHCTSRTYFSKYANVTILTAPTCGSTEVEVFPDPVPYELDGNLHYQPRSDPTEILQNLKMLKNVHTISLSHLQHKRQKNVGFTIKYCSKLRLLHSKTKVICEDVKGVKRMLG